MKFIRALVVCSGLVACQPAEHAAPAAPAAAPVANPGPGADLAPNADAARYGPHGVATTPPALPTTPPQGPKAEPGAADTAATAPALPAGDDSMAEMRGHPCECGKTCHCGHCSGAVPGCHCHIKRADGKE